jgi:ribosomal protein S18 acetylase RimI-like enzyme
MNLTLRKLTTYDLPFFIELIRVFEDVFEMKDFRMPPEAHLEKLLAKEDFYVFVALQDEKVIGGLTAYRMDQYYSVSPLVYIYDLAVKREFQRKGVGKLLIEENKKYCHGIGAEAIMVEADDEDEYAIDFYRKTGGEGIKVVHFDYYLK